MGGGRAAERLTLHAVARQLVQTRDSHITLAHSALCDLRLAIGDAGILAAVATAPESGLPVLRTSYAAFIGN